MVHLCLVTPHHTLPLFGFLCSVDDAFLSSTKSNALVMLVPVLPPSTSSSTSSASSTSTAPSVYFYFYLLSLSAAPSQGWLGIVNRRTRSLFVSRHWQKTKHSNSKTIRGHIDIDFPGKTHLSIYWPPLGLTDRLGHRSEQQQLRLQVKMKLGPVSIYLVLFLNWGNRGQ